MQAKITVVAESIPYGGDNDGTQLFINPDDYLQTPYVQSLLAKEGSAPAAPAEPAEPAKIAEPAAAPEPAAKPGPCEEGGCQQIYRSPRTVSICMHVNGTCTCLNMGLHAAFCFGVFLY